MHSKRAENEEQGSYRHPNPIFQDFQELQRPNSRVFQDSTNSFSTTFQDTFNSRGDKLHTMYYHEFLVY